MRRGKEIEEAGPVIHPKEKSLKESRGRVQGLRERENV